MIIGNNQAQKLQFGHIQTQLAVVMLKQRFIDPALIIFKTKYGVFEKNVIEFAGRLLAHCEFSGRGVVFLMPQYVPKSDTK